MTGIEDEKELDDELCKEMAQNEASALKLHYERRCKMLSDLVMHWKDQTNVLYAKLNSSLDVLKREHEKYKEDSNEEIRKLKHRN